MTAPKTMRTTNVSTAYSRSQVRAAINAAYRALQPCSWRKFGEQKGISGSMLNAVARGKRPPSDAVLRAFGFPVPRVVEVPEGYGVGQACKSCGQVHTTKRCPTTRQVRVRRLHELSDGEIRAAFENRKAVKVA